VYHSLDMSTNSDGTVVCIGTFDGVHVGHQAILSRVREVAGARGLASIAYAFDAPPRWTQAGEPDRTLLLPRATKRALLQAYVDRVIPVALADVRHIEPAAFAEAILVEQLQARVVVVGEGFRFGRDRGGTVEDLERHGSRLGFETVAVARVEADGALVSSTRIRSLVVDGRVREAAPLLGRPPLLVGIVEAGDRLGRSLGYPTANLEIDPHELLPGAGIYVIHAFCKGSRHEGLLYIGDRPTIGGGSLRCEVHLLTPGPIDLYGVDMEVHLLKRLREDRAFDSLDALRAQIERDIVAAREHLLAYGEQTTRFSG